MYELWIIKNYGNKTLKIKRESTFIITECKKISDERKIIFETTKYFSKYKTESGVELLFPNDNRTYYDCEIWNFPNSYKNTKLENIQIVINEDLKYIKVPIGNSKK